MLIRHDKLLLIEVPKESTEHDIDDFLGNTLQYKLNNVWVYDTLNRLPSTNLEILDILKDDEYQDIDIDRNKKWLLIKKI